MCGGAVRLPLFVPHGPKDRQCQLLPHVLQVASLVVSREGAEEAATRQALRAPRGYGLEARWRDTTRTAFGHSTNLTPLEE